MKTKILLAIGILSIATYLQILKKKSIKHIWWFKSFSKDTKETLNKKVSFISIIDSLEKKANNHNELIVSFYLDNKYYLYKAKYDSNNKKLSFSISEIDYNQAHFWNEDSYFGLC